MIKTVMKASGNGEQSSINPTKTSRQKRKEKRLWSRLSLWAALVVCLGIAGYPLLSNYAAERENSKLILQYQDEVGQQTPEEYERELAACREYNQRLNIEVSDSSGEYRYLERDMDYRERLNLNGNGMMGILEIPAINITLPIYHSTEEDVLNSGIGHLEGSSLPVGGEGTHTVLTGHTGMSSKRMLTDLTDVVEGDWMILQVLGEKLYYRVDQIKTVLPYETEDLQRVAGKDYATVLTCTPYGINSHRLLVRGTRVESLPEGTGEPDFFGSSAETDRKSNWLTRYFQALFLGILVFLGVLALAKLYFYIGRNRNALLLLGAFLLLGISLLYGYWIFQKYEEANRYYRILQESVLEENEVSMLSSDTELFCNMKFAADSKEYIGEQNPTIDPYGDSNGGCGAESGSDAPRIVNFDILNREAAPEGHAIGWLYGPNTVLDYPVGFSGDNTWFLSHTLDGEERISGMLFLDGACAEDFSGPHSILYGHCMRNGSMFGTLKNYRNQDYYEQHSFLYLTLPDGSCFRICIFSAFIADSQKEPEFWKTDFYGREDPRMEQWLETVCGRSQIQSRYVLPEDAKILTLSTCAYEYSNAKFLVAGFLEPVSR